MPAAALVTTDPSSLIDLARYPILDLDAAAMRDVLAWARAQLRETGACEVPGFLTPAGLETIRDDAVALAPTAHRGEGYGTAYLELPDFELAEDHPRRWIGRAAVGVVAYDMFPAGSPLRRLYEWDPFMRFIEAVLERGDVLGIVAEAMAGEREVDEGPRRFEAVERFGWYGRYGVGHPMRP